MNTPAGLVVSVDGDDAHRHALVDIDVSQACPRCAAGKGCGAGLMSGKARRRRVEASVPAGRDVKVGDTVRLSLAPRNLLLAAFTVYGWPLLGAATAVFIAYRAGLGDGAAAIAALAGLAAGLMLARWRLATRCLGDFTPRVLS